MIRVTAPPSVHSNSNAPIHLVVVLDLDVRVGQQQQQQQQQEAGRPGLLQALLKTMEFIRGELLGDNRIDVVDAFRDQTQQTTIDAWISDAQAENLVPRSRRTELKRLLESAVQILDKSNKPNKSNPGGGGGGGDDVKRVGFILLLSDGQSKLTESDSRALLSGEYPVHALGLGINHDDPDPPGMLHRIAQGCSVTYSSIARADDLNKSKLLLMEAVAVCLGGLKSVVAIRTRVKIGVKLDDPYSGNLMNEESIEIKVSKSKKQGFTVGDGVLYAGEVKDLIVDIVFRTIRNSSRTRSATLTATVEYVDSSSSRREAPTTVECTLPLLITGTSNEPAITAYKKCKQLLPNPMVLQRMIMLEVLEKLEEFAGILLKPPPPTTTTTTKTPATTTTKTTTTTPTAGDQLRRTWDDLKKKGKSLQVAQKMGSLIDLRGIDSGMEAMASCLERYGVSLGLSCIDSWVSSYKMQRATTTGLPLPAIPFLTPAMETMLHNARNKHTVEMDKQKQDDAAVPLSLPVAEENTVKKTGNEKTSTAQTITALDDKKSELAIWLMEHINSRFKLYEESVQPFALPMSGGLFEGNQMSETHRDALDLLKKQIHQASEKVINKWQELEASSSSVNDQLGARPA